MNKTLKNLMLLSGGIGLGAVGMLNWVGFAFSWKSKHPNAERDKLYELKGLGKNLFIINGKGKPKGVNIAIVYANDKTLKEEES